MENENFDFKWNIQNILSLYRLCSFPFILFLIFTHHQLLFVWLFSINLLTDILDGFIARTFNMQTKLGAKLDSYADVGSVILGVAGIYVFRWEGFAANPFPFFIYLFLYLSSMLYGFLKYNEIQGFHIYSFKFIGYVQGIFLFTTFVFEFFDLFYLITMFMGVLACIEEIILITLLPKPIVNAKGLYWILKSKKA